MMQIKICRICEDWKPKGNYAHGEFEKRRPTCKGCAKEMKGRA